MTTELISAAKEAYQDQLEFGVGGPHTRISTLFILANALGVAIETVPPSGDEVDRSDVLCKPAEPITIQLDVTRRQAAIMHHHLTKLIERLVGEVMKSLKELE